MSIFIRIVNLFFIAFIMNITPLFGQFYSGFLGKHYIIHYDYITSPSITAPTPKSGSNDKGIYTRDGFYQGFNKIHAFEAEWLINKRYSAGLIYHTFNTKVDIENDYQYLSHQEVSIYTDESDMVKKTTYSNKYFGKVKAYSFGISSTFFTRALNPVGGYLKLDIFRTNYKINILQASISEDEPGSEAFVDDRYHTYGLTVQFGKQKIYFERIAVRYGIQVGHVFKSMKLHPTSTDVIFYGTNTRLRQQYDLNLNIGIGYLIF